MLHYKAIAYLLLQGGASFQPEHLQLDNTVRMKSSDVISFGGIAFTASTQMEWVPGVTKVKGLAETVELQLHLENTTGRDIALLETDLVRLKLSDKKGSELPYRIEKTDRLQTPVILLPRRGFYTINRQMDLVINEAEMTCSLKYYQGVSGIVQCYDNLSPGKYDVSLCYSSNIPKGVPHIKNQAWIGEVATPAMPIVVADKGRRARDPRRKQPIAGSQILRVCNTTPKSSDDTSLAISTGSHWISNEKPSEYEIQLEIANQSGSDRWYTIFDAIDLTLIDHSGQSARTFGGRDFVNYQPPVLIGPKCKYVHFSYVHFERNAKTDAWDLFYHDGTGSVVNFEGLKAGEYTLRATYKSGGRTIVDPLIDPIFFGKDHVWKGTIVANDIVVTFGSSGAKIRSAEAR